MRRRVAEGKLSVKNVLKWSILNESELILYMTQVIDVRPPEQPPYFQLADMW